MELKDDEFKALRSRVDQLSSELEKKDAARAVNTRWMVAVGSIIVAALGYTNFVQLPAEAAKAAKEQVGPEIVDKANEIVMDLEAKRQDINELAAFAEENFGYLKDKELVPVYMFQEKNKYNYYCSPILTTGSGWERRPEPLFYAFIDESQ